MNMGTERRRQLLLGALAVVLAIVVYSQWPGTAPQSPPPSNQQGAAGTSGVARGRAGKAPAPAQTTDVHLEALSAERPKPEPTERNLFRFRERRPPPPPPSAAQPPAAIINPEPAGPPPPPPLAPINLKCFGTISKAAGGPKLVTCTDGNGPPESVAEGQLVLGRYRILKIGEESIEVAYADGRGRQTIRITGS
jgi:hypothetical protein